MLIGLLLPDTANAPRTDVDRPEAAADSEAAIDTASPATDDMAFSRFIGMRERAAAETLAAKDAGGPSCSKAVGTASDLGEVRSATISSGGGGSRPADTAAVDAG